MGNMSYCRFENTVRDMRDCIDAIESGDTDELNEYELEALEQFLSLADEIKYNEHEIKSILIRYQ
jgi:hypothetical protein